MADPLFLWDADAHRYRDAGTGRFVTRATVRHAFEESLVNLQRHTDQLAADLRAGRISLTAWREEMRLVIKQTQMAAAELASGGREQMTQSDYGRVGQRVRRQYEYLEKWVGQIKEGLPFDGRMETRAGQYLKSARSSYLALDQRTLRAQGFDEIRTILHPAEHCAECIAEAERGFVPIRNHVPIGQRQCRDNDRCTAEYRNSQTGQVIAA